MIKYRIHVIENKKEIKSNFRSSNNLETLISPKRTSREGKEFLIKLKKNEEKNFDISNKAFKANSKESNSSKLRPIDLSKNSNKNFYSNTKTQISSDSTSKNITPKYNWEENKDYYKEKANTPVHLNKKPPLGDFKSPNHKKNNRQAFPGSFFDLNKVPNEKKSKRDWKEIDSYDNLDCSLDELLKVDDGTCKSQDSLKQGKKKYK